HVTGVQTCALPISARRGDGPPGPRRPDPHARPAGRRTGPGDVRPRRGARAEPDVRPAGGRPHGPHWRPPLPALPLVHRTGGPRAPLARGTGAPRPPARGRPARGRGPP